MCWKSASTRVSFLSICSPATHAHPTTPTLIQVGAKEEHIAFHKVDYSCLIDNEDFETFGKVIEDAATEFETDDEVRQRARTAWKEALRTYAVLTPQGDSLLDQYVQLFSCANGV